MAVSSGRWRAKPYEDGPSRLGAGMGRAGAVLEADRRLQNQLEALLEEAHIKLFSWGSDLLASVRDGC